MYFSPLSLAAANSETGDHSTVAVSARDGAHNLAHQVIDALGGMDAVKKLYAIKALSLGKMTDYSAMSGAANTVEVRLLSQKDKFKIDLQVLGQAAVTGYNGKVAWQQHGNEVFPSDPITTKKIAEDSSHGILLLMKFEDPSLKMRLLPEQTMHGKQCPCLEVTDESGVATKLYVDPDDHMVLAVEYMGTDFEQGAEALKRTEFFDYRPCLNSFVAYKSVEYTGGKKTSEQFFDSVEILADSDESVFDMPIRKGLDAFSKGPVVIPFEYVSNEVIVKAKVNDRTELKFLLDTGATQNVMEKASATTFGTVTKSNMALTTGSGFVTMGGIVLSSLQLGDLKLTDVPMAVADMPGFAQIKGTRPAGIIGANVLRRFAVTIDYEERKVYFRDPSTLKIPDGATVLQAQPALGSVGLSVDGVANGSLKLRLLVDTGAAFNSISESILKPVLDFPLLPVGSVEGVDGYKVEVGSVQLTNLSLDKLTVDDPIFSVTTIPATSKMPAGLLSASSLGILGNPYWSHFRLTVDYLNARIILEETETSKLGQRLLREGKDISKRYIREHDSEAAIAKLDELLLQARQPELIRTKTLLCLLRARLLAEKNFAAGGSAGGSGGQNTQPGQNAHSAQNTHGAAATGTLSAQGIQETQGASAVRSPMNEARLFDPAFALAKEINDGQLQAKVLADECMFFLDNGTLEGNELHTVRKLLQVAASYSESEPDVLVAAAVFFDKTMPMSSTRRMLDQALVLDPANWRGLVERYHIAKKDGKSSEAQKLLELIHHYYPGCNPPASESQASKSPTAKPNLPSAKAN